MTFKALRTVVRKVRQESTGTSSQLGPSSASEAEEADEEVKTKPAWQLQRFWVSLERSWELGDSRMRIRAATTAARKTLRSNKDHKRRMIESSRKVREQVGETAGAGRSEINEQYLADMRKEKRRSQPAEQGEKLNAAQKVEAHRAEQRFIAARNARGTDKLQETSI